VGRAAVLNGDEDDAILVWDVDVHEEHPPPRAEQEAIATPATRELSAEERKALEMSE
jgi:hypothetical protein